MEVAMKLRFRLAVLALSLLAGMVGYGVAQDGDDYRYDRDDYYRYGHFRKGMRVASEIGFRDGAEVAREDMWKGKPFNPRPRGRYDDADHGYRHEFGNKHEYREHYTEAYRDGYVSTFRQGRYYDRYDRY
jgi:hypothetical protein